MNAHRSDSKETATANVDKLKIAADNAAKAATHPGNQVKAAKKDLDAANANLKKQIEYRDNVVAKGIANYNEANKKLLPEAQQNVKYASNMVDIEKGLQKDAESKAKDAADKLAKDEAARDDALAYRAAYDAMVKSSTNDLVNKSQALQLLKQDPNAKNPAWAKRLATAAKIVNDEYKDGLKVSDVQTKLDSAKKSSEHLMNVVNADKKAKDSADQTVTTAKANVVRANKDFATAQSLLKQVGGTIDNNNNTNTNTDIDNTGETPALGIVYMPAISGHPNWKVNMLDADGHYTNVYLTTNSKWRVFGKKTINGVECYRLGNQNQWVPAQYVALS